MSWYTDGVDDGKSEKFDELMVEIVALREQLKETQNWGEPVAIVADVYQSLYTLDWCGQSYSQGTKLYAKKEEEK
jgi:hypothetical protein